MLSPWKESDDKPKQSIKKQRHHFANKDSYKVFFSNSHVQLWELDHKEAWALKNRCFELRCWVVLEKILENPLGYKEIKPINPKGNQPWIFTGRTVEALILWPPDVESPLIRKDPDAGKDWRYKEKGVAENERVR